MRLQIGFLIAIAACLSLTAAETKHEFAVYLTAEPVDGRITAYGTGDWSRVKLDASPIISDADILWYAWSDHSIRLRPEALKRIPRPPVHGAPFVVVVDGRRIYLGAFTTCLSSASLAVLSIMVDRRMIVTNQPADILIIERAYPQASFGVGPDPRPDTRIKDALSALGKLESKEQPPTVAQVEKPGLVTEVIPAKQTVKLGEPIVVSVRVTNQVPKDATAIESATAFDCFEVTGPDGMRLPYIGFDGQARARTLEVPPSSTVTIAETIDLTDKYLFQNPGQYAVRLSSKEMGLPDSPAIAIEITPGQLSDFDAVVTSLLPICPAGWNLVKDRRGDVTPFGWTRVPGFALHLCNDHMRGKAVLLWFTKEEAKADPIPRDREHRFDEGKYWGQARGYHVYASVGQNTPPLWPAAKEEISRALRLPIIVNILKTGGLQLEGQDVKDEELAARLKTISAKYPDQPVIVKADKQTGHKDVIRVLDLCRKSGISNVAFGAEEPTAEPADQGNAIAPPKKSVAEIRTSPEFESFLANFIAAVNAKDREKLKAGIHPKSLAELAADKDSEQKFALRFSTAIPAKHDVFVTELGTNGPSFLAFAVRPTHQVQINCFKPDGNQTGVILYLIQEGGQWLEVLPTLVAPKTSETSAPDTGEVKAQTPDATTRD